MSEFKVGDKVTHKEYGEVEVTYISADIPKWIAYRHLNGSEMEYTTIPSNLAPIRPVDPRVEVAARALYEAYEAYNSSCIQWSDLPDDFAITLRKRAEKVIAALDQIGPAVVWDSDGDIWTREIDGSYRLSGNNGHDEIITSYETLQKTYGPLSVQLRSTGD